MNNLLINRFKDYSKEYFTLNEIIKIIEGNVFPILKIGGITANPQDLSIKIAGVKQYFPRMVFQIIYYMMEHCNKNITREMLLRDLWGDDVIVTKRTIDVHIYKIRKIVGKDTIKTLKRSGYIWIN
jgi:hypothetical protein